MTVAELFSDFPDLFEKLQHIADKKVNGIYSDSRKIKSGDIFVAIKGISSDGHQHVTDVAAIGALLVISEKDFTVKCPVLVVEDTRKIFAKLSEVFLQKPSQKLFLIGVTGTNGKTTITHMIEHLFNKLQSPTGVIGTIDHHLLKKSWPTELTTPDAAGLSQRLKDFLDHQAMAAALEVSSHALDQKRVDGLHFDVAIFSNLTRDHLDYHGDMQNYFYAKSRLFEDVLWNSCKPTRTAIIYTDDIYGADLYKLMIDKKWCRTLSVGEKNADFQILPRSSSVSGSQFILKTPQGSVDISLPIVGQHNIINASLSFAAAMAKGFSIDEIALAMSDFPGVRGRLQKLKTKKIHAFVDFAHSEDALSVVLKTLKANLPKSSRLITVFGCGGDRDKGKRPRMMKVVKEFSNIIFVTSDNPRSEDPEKIIDDILVESTKSEHIFRESDRKIAIHKAIDLAQDNDVILIAGKGHETYQILGKNKISFDDAAIAESYISEKQK